jgi:hypothetical protein
MKPTLTVMALLSLCLAQQAWADTGVPSDDVDVLSTSTLQYGTLLNASDGAAGADRNIHDPGITILEAFLRQVRRVFEAVIRFGDGIRGRIPAD